MEITMGWTFSWDDGNTINSQHFGVNTKIRKDSEVFRDDIN
jgi:hypothetical protein